MKHSRSPPRPGATHAARGSFAGRNDPTSCFVCPTKLSSELSSTPPALTAASTCSTKKRLSHSAAPCPSERLSRRPRWYAYPSSAASAPARRSDTAGTPPWSRMKRRRRRTVTTSGVRDVRHASRKPFTAAFSGPLKRYGELYAALPAPRREVSSSATSPRSKKARSRAATVRGARPEKAAAAPTRAPWPTATRGGGTRRPRRTQGTRARQRTPAGQSRAGRAGARRATRRARATEAAAAAGRQPGQRRRRRAGSEGRRRAGGSRSSTGRWLAPRS